MEKMSDANVAGVAKQASDIARFRGVIDVKDFCAAPIGISSAADRALTILFSQKVFVGAVGDTETPFKMAVAFLSRISFVPFYVVFAVFLGVTFLPFAYFRDVARLAHSLQSVVCGFVFVKLGAQFDLFAARASFVGVGVAFELVHFIHPGSRDGLVCHNA